MTTIATVNLFNSGSDYAVNAFGLVQGLSSSVSFDTTGSFTIPANSSIPITAEYDGAPVDQTAALYPRNLFVVSSVGTARFYAVPNFVIVQPPPPPPPPPGPPPPPQPVFYTLSVNGGPNIVSTVGSGLYSGGTAVPVDMTPAPGYEFVQWSDNIQFLVSPRTVKSNTIIMPAQNVVITPEVQLIPTPTTTTPEPTTTTTTTEEPIFYNLTISAGIGSNPLCITTPPAGTTSYPAGTVLSFSYPDLCPEANGGFGGVFATGFISPPEAGNITIGPGTVDINVTMNSDVSIELTWIVFD